MIRVFDDWLLLPQRIALHEPSATAVLADAHLGYSAARQHLGDAVPEGSVADDMQLLHAAARSHNIRRLIVAGDLFERGFNAGLFAEFHKVLSGLRIDLLAVVPGNHDRGIDRAESVPLFAAGFDLHGWHICHGDQAVESPRAVMGHWHPAVRMKGRKVPAFLVRGGQVVLPAFSLDAAGVDVQADERWREWTCHAIVGGKIKSPDRASGISK